MTDSTAESDAFAGMMAAHPLAGLDAQDRQRNLRRSIAVAAAVVVHILIITLILVSNQVPLIKRIKETIPEAITWIPMPPSSHRRIEQPPPNPQAQPFPQITAPITLPPVPHRQETQQPGDLIGVGRSIACGASSYENLSPQQREHCLRHPWAYVKRPDGTIVLDAPKPVEPPPSIADIMRHEQQTAPPCPVLQNVPCLGKVVGGSSSPF